MITNFKTYESLFFSNNNDAIIKRIFNDIKNNFNENKLKYRNLIVADSYIYNTSEFIFEIRKRTLKRNNNDKKYIIIINNKEFDSSYFLAKKIFNFFDKK